MNFYYTKNKFDQPIGILHFGIGLIGTTIQKNLLTHGFFEKVEYSKHLFDWNFPEKTDLYLSDFFKDKAPLLKSLEKIYIIWSAGKAGFRSSEEEVNTQLSHFKLTLDELVQNIEILNLPFAFFLISSAGGLFEGQTLIHEKSKPDVKRPYGYLKLAEEHALLNHSASFEKNIFRVSSVYSIDVVNKRKGLMLVLMKNGLQQKVSTIFGQEFTIRDYILDKDIANYFSYLIYEKVNPGSINFLVSGKPSSIYEIRKLIEKILKKRIYIYYSPTKSNAEHMSYIKQILPKNFRPSNLETNLKKLYLNLIN